MTGKACSWRTEDRGRRTPKPGQRRCMDSPGAWTA